MTFASRFGFAGSGLRAGFVASLALVGIVGCVSGDEDSAAADETSEGALGGTSTLPALKPGERPDIVFKHLGARSQVEIVACRGHVTATEPKQYVSRATFRADGQGRVDLAKDAPVEGAANSYSGKDAFGLMWSMKEETCPFTSAAWSYGTVRFQINKPGAPPRIIEQPMLDVAPGVTTQDLTLAADGVIGRLYKPAGAGPFPGVVVWGGSDGMLPDAQGKLFASRGYATLAIQYFDYVAAPNTIPSLILDVPLEYFGTAIEWLRTKPFVTRNKVAIVGSSRGGEAALLVGSRYGDKLTAVVAARPSDIVWGDRANGTQSRNIGVADELASWTWQGAPVPFLPMPKLLQELSDESTFNGIPAFKYRKAYETVESTATAAARAAARIDTRKIPVPIFACGGTDDQLWPASRYVERMKQARRFTRVGSRDRYVVTAGAGHYTATPDRPTHPDLQFWFPSGINDKMENGEYVMVPEYAINGGNPFINHVQDVDVFHEMLDFLEDNR